MLIFLTLTFFQEAEESSQKPDEEVTETTAMLGNEEEVKHIGTIEAWSRGGLTNKCGIDS